MKDEIKLGSFLLSAIQVLTEHKETVDDGVQYYTLREWFCRHYSKDKGYVRALNELVAAEVVVLVKIHKEDEDGRNERVVRVQFFPSVTEADLRNTLVYRTDNLPPFVKDEMDVVRRNERIYQEIITRARQ